MGEVAHPHKSAHIREPGIFTVVINRPAGRVLGLVIDVIPLWHQSAWYNVAQRNRQPIFEYVQTRAIGDESRFNVDPDDYCQLTVRADGHFKIRRCASGHNEMHPLSCLVKEHMEERELCVHHTIHLRCQCDGIVCARGDLNGTFLKRIERVQGGGTKESMQFVVWCVHISEHPRNSGTEEYER